MEAAGVAYNELRLESTGMRTLPAVVAEVYNVAKRAQGCTIESLVVPPLGS